MDEGKALSHNVCEMISHQTKIGMVGVVALFASGCSLGPAELLIIFAIVVLLFGATRLPQLGKALGETIKSFRKSSGIDNLEEGKNDAVVKIEDAKVEPAEEKKADEA